MGASISATGAEGLLWAVLAQLSAAASSRPAPPASGRHAVAARIDAEIDGVPIALSLSGAVRLRGGAIVGSTVRIGRAQ